LFRSAIFTIKKTTYKKPLIKAPSQDIDFNFPYSPKYKVSKFGKKESSKQFELGELGRMGSKVSKKESESIGKEKSEENEKEWIEELKKLEIESEESKTLKLNLSQMKALIMLALSKQNILDIIINKYHAFTQRGKSMNSIDLRRYASLKCSNPKYSNIFSLQNQHFNKHNQFKTQITQIQKRIQFVLYQAQIQYPLFFIPFF
jgi:hypothetical protein